MIKAVIENYEGKTAVLDLSKNWSELYKSLQGIGIYISPDEIKLNSQNDREIKVRLYSDSDFGNGLIKILTSDDTLLDAYALEDTFKNLRVEFKEELECDILNEQYDTKEELYTDIRKMKKEFAPFIESYYCPLSCSFEDLLGGYNRVPSSELTGLKELISEALAHEQPPNLDMAGYLGKSSDMTDKLVYAVWAVDEFNGELYGRIDCYLTEKLTEEETEKLRIAINGQNSDGFGEGFEQHPISTESGDYYVSFLSSDKSYFLCTESELPESISKRNEIKMGGL